MDTLLGIGILVLVIINFVLYHKIFDVIYFDPFSKKHNSEMWSDDMFCKLYSLLETGGVLTTYASGKGIKESLVNAGFSISSLVSLGTRYQPATKAVKY